MATARRRDEWNRTAALLDLVHNRTLSTVDAKGKSIDPQYTTPLDWMPPNLISASERRRIREAERRAREQRVIKVPFDTIRQIVLGPHK